MWFQVENARLQYKRIDRHVGYSGSAKRKTRDMINTAAQNIGTLVL